MLIPTIAIWLVLGYIGGRLFARKGYPPIAWDYHRSIVWPNGTIDLCVFSKVKRGP